MGIIENHRKLLTKFLWCTPHINFLECLESFIHFLTKTKLVYAFGLFIWKILDFPKNLHWKYQKDDINSSKYQKLYVRFLFFCKITICPLFPRSIPELLILLLLHWETKKRRIARQRNDWNSSSIIEAIGPGPISGQLAFNLQPTNQPSILEAVNLKKSFHASAIQ